MNSIDLYNIIRKKYASLSEFDKLEMYMKYYIKEVSFNNKVHVLNIKPELPLLQESVFTSYDNTVPGFKSNRKLGIMGVRLLIMNQAVLSNFVIPITAIYLMLVKIGKKEDMLVDTYFKHLVFIRIFI